MNLTVIGLMHRVHYDAEHMANLTLIDLMNLVYYDAEHGAAGFQIHNSRVDEIDQIDSRIGFLVGDTHAYSFTRERIHSRAYTPAHTCTCRGPHLRGQ